MQSVEIIKEPKIWRPVAVVCLILREKFFASVQSFCTAFNLSTLQERQLQAVFNFVMAIMVDRPTRFSRACFRLNESFCPHGYIC